MRLYEFGIVVDSASSAPSDLRVIGTDELPIYHGFSISIVDHDGSSINQRLSEVLAVNRPHRVADYFEENDVRYAIRSAAYHVDRMATYYAEHTGHFEARYRAGSAVAGNTDDARVAFEVDAFLGAARRFYEQLRRLLWKHYGSGNSRPDSFRKLLHSDVRLPEAYRSVLTESWTVYGTRLREYRDCMSHYDPLNDGSTTCWLELHDERWRMTFRLPNNPETRSRRRFSFEPGPDALSYCHDVLCHLTGLAESTGVLLAEMPRPEPGTP